MAALQKILEQHLPAADPTGTDPQPAALLLESAPPHRLYQLAVSRTLHPQTAWDHAPPDVTRLTPPGRRGEIGALAACAWPADRTTEAGIGAWSWEYTAYRAPHETAPGRDLPPGFQETLRAMPGGFDNLDVETGRLRAVPRTPCPVRLAVRGRDPSSLLEAFTGLPGMPGWLLLTNQATGDHARYAAPTLASHQVTMTRVRVQAHGRRGRGGHLLVQATTDQGTPLQLAAFEPTKGLREALEATCPGDRLEVLGRTGEDPHVLALEAFRVIHLEPRWSTGPNPRCPECAGATKSRGRGAGYRCPDCRLRLPPDAKAALRLEDPLLREGAAFQVPDHVRGHLLPPAGGLPGSHDLFGANEAAVPSVFDRTPIEGPRMRALG
jgi:tRNA(Ile2)-agmatinylcytidine synthase